jgi:hypothetical protein
MGTVGHNKKKKIKARYANLKLGRFTLLSYHEINAILFHHESIDLSYGLFMRASSYFNFTGVTPRRTVWYGI